MWNSEDSDQTESSLDALVILMVLSCSGSNFLYSESIDVINKFFVSKALVKFTCTI